MHFDSRYKKQVGSEKEQAAGSFLRMQGYEILEYNFFTKFGEIDIVAKDGEYLVFVEVKYRSNKRNGLPEEAISYKKMQKITKAAQYYMLRHGLTEDTPCRFDAVVVLGQEQRLIKDAFEAVVPVCR